MCHTIFALDAITLAVTCPTIQQSERLADLWQTLFTVQRRESLASVPTVSISFTSPDQPHTQPALLVPVQQSPYLDVWTTAAGFYLCCGRSWLSLDLDRNCATGVLDDSLWEQPLLAQRDFFLLTLVMLLRRLALYALHANGVVADETGYLIIGGSGHGKTTLTISLIRAGWQYLADDALLLRTTRQGVEALALRRSFACTSQTTERFPELARIREPTADTGDGKHPVAIEALYADRFRPACLPRVLLFPRIVGGRHSRLVPLDATTTMIQLMQQSAGIFTDRPVGKQHLALLGQLVQQTQSYELLLGDDVFDAAADVSRLLCYREEHGAGLPSSVSLH